jgi:hypothetical protein
VKARAVTSLRFLRHVALWFVALVVIPPLVVVLIAPALVSVLR